MSTETHSELVVAVEREARQIAAWKMGLVKDRRGERLPDDLWRQAARSACENIGIKYEDWTRAVQVQS